MNLISSVKDNLSHDEDKPYGIQKAVMEKKKQVLRSERLGFKS